MKALSVYISIVCILFLLLLCYLCYLWGYDFSGWSMNLIEGHSGEWEIYHGPWNENGDNPEACGSVDICSYKVPDTVAGEDPLSDQEINRRTELCELVNFEMPTQSECLAADGGGVCSWNKIPRSCHNGTCTADNHCVCDAGWGPEGDCGKLKTDNNFTQRGSKRNILNCEDMGNTIECELEYNRPVPEGDSLTQSLHGMCNPSSEEHRVNCEAVTELDNPTACNALMTSEGDQACIYSYPNTDYNWDILLPPPEWWRPANYVESRATPDRMNSPRSTTRAYAVATREMLDKADPDGFSPENPFGWGTLTRTGQHLSSKGFRGVGPCGDSNISTDSRPEAHGYLSEIPYPLTDPIRHGIAYWHNIPGLAHFAPDGQVALQYYNRIQRCLQDESDWKYVRASPVTDGVLAAEGDPTFRPGPGKNYCTGFCPDGGDASCSTQLVRDHGGVGANGERERDKIICVKTDDMKTCEGPSLQENRAEAQEIAVRAEEAAVASETLLASLSIQEDRPVQGSTDYGEAARNVAQRNALLLRQEATAAVAAVTALDSGESPHSNISLDWGNCTAR